MFAQKTLLAATALTTTLFATPSQAYDEQHWGSAGIFNVGVGNVILGEYETKIDQGVSLGWRVGTTSYSFSSDSGNYTENGGSFGVEGTLRFYKEPVSFRGQYWGIGMGLWSTSYNYVDYGTPGSGNRIDLSINGTLGWKIRMSRGNYFIDPSITVGIHTGLLFYAGMGVQVGTRF